MKAIGGFVSAVGWFVFIAVILGAIAWFFFPERTKAFLGVEQPSAKVSLYNEAPAAEDESDPPKEDEEESAEEKPSGEEESTKAGGEEYAGDEPAAAKKFLTMYKASDFEERKQCAPVPMPPVEVLERGEPVKMIRFPGGDDDIPDCAFVMLMCPKGQSCKAPAKGSVAELQNSAAAKEVQKHICIRGQKAWSGTRCGSIVTSDGRKLLWVSTRERLAD